ncbi:uncharacterized protein LOC129286512 [Prosopis cineraria]|uniref:uncharacterized protein LOC129286512 n=1 Tax=Prosopis cineraria TaxID=364024 RepID=UPI00240FC128|nr:uncharacterized protein LOC129286512 [Prosopis cineraria]
MGQIATAVTALHKGGLPSNMETNPRREGNEECKSTPKPEVDQTEQDVSSTPPKAKIVSVEDDIKKESSKELPPKCHDPGSFSIPCVIGDKFQGGALCDLGSSINLMPLFVFRKLQLGEASPTSMTLQLADRSLAFPKGKIEDLLVKVDKFIFPIDFFVLDCDEDRDLPLIVGRPFLATARALIDVERGEIKLRVNDEEVSFNMHKAMKYPGESEIYFKVDILDEVVRETLESFAVKDSLYAILLGNDVVKNDDIVECKKLLQASPYYLNSKRVFESLELEFRQAPSLKPSIEQALTLELKSLPPHLTYAYLGEFETLPIIISSALSDDQKERLLRVIRDHK